MERQMYKILSEHRQVFKAKSFHLFFIWEIIFFAVFLYFALVVFVKKDKRMKGIRTYIDLMKEPEKTWKKLAQNPNQSGIKAAYIILVSIIPFSIIGKMLDIAELNWNILITNALVAFISLLTGLYVATSLCKLYNDKTTQQSMSFSDTLYYVAHASVAVYATVWLVELAQMPIFWLCSLYTLKIVLESLQSKYIAIEEEKKYSYVWVVSSIIIASPYFMHYVLGLIIKG